MPLKRCKRYSGFSVGHAFFKMELAGLQLISMRPYAHIATREPRFSEIVKDVAR